MTMIQEGKNKKKHKVKLYTREKKQKKKTKTQKADKITKLTTKTKHLQGHTSTHAHKDLHLEIIVYTY